MSEAKSSKVRVVVQCPECEKYIMIELEVSGGNK